LAGTRIDLDGLWFLYSSDKQTYFQLTERFCCSTGTVQRMVGKVHIVKRKEFSSTAAVIMDTTYFGRGFGVMVFKTALTAQFYTGNMYAIKPMRYIWQGYLKSFAEAFMFKVLFATEDRDCSGCPVIFPYKCVSSTGYEQSCVI
jgi:hypothetical protein